jgi:hypothetical protein
MNIAKKRTPLLIKLSTGLTLFRVLRCVGWTGYHQRQASYQDS